VEEGAVIIFPPGRLLIVGRVRGPAETDWLTGSPLPNPETYVTVYELPPPPPSEPEHPDRTNPNANVITSIPKTNKLFFFIKVLLKISEIPSLAEGYKKEDQTPLRRALYQGILSKASSCTPETVWSCHTPPFSGFLLFQSGAKTPVKTIFSRFPRLGRCTLSRTKREISPKTPVFWAGKPLKRGVTRKKYIKNCKFGPNRQNCGVF
jgi:hypothetical protein